MTTEQTIIIYIIIPSKSICYCQANWDALESSKIRKDLLNEMMHHIRFAD